MATRDRRLRLRVRSNEPGVAYTVEDGDVVLVVYDDGRTTRYPTEVGGRPAQVAPPDYIEYRRL